MYISGNFWHFHGNTKQNENMKTEKEVCETEIFWRKQNGTSFSGGTGVEIEIMFPPNT
jgi:hypothetical protein